jgi:hypothetical protein
MKIDLNDPRIEKVKEILFAQIEKALVVPQRVEDAVFPIYYPLRSNKPEQIGTGVVIRIGGQFFVFSASHVFDSIGTFQLLLGLGGGQKLLSVSGDRFSTARGRSGTHADDPVDASVFHLQSEVPDELAKVALSYTDLDFSHPDGKRSVFLISGFRVKESRTSGNQANANRGCYPTGEYGPTEYSALALDADTHIALAFEDRVLVNGRWEASPLLRGVSGGAIIRIEGVSVAPPFPAAKRAVQLLTAIAIEHRRERLRKPGAVVGVRIPVHLSLIRRFLPSLVLN